MFGNLLDSVVNTVDDFISDPIGETINMATQPLRDTVDVLDGLSEGELREKAIMRLGADAVAGMAVGELIEWYLED